MDFNNPLLTSTILWSYPIMLFISNNLFIYKQEFHNSANAAQLRSIQTTDIRALAELCHIPFGPDALCVRNTMSLCGVSGRLQRLSVPLGLRTTAAIQRSRAEVVRNCTNLSDAPNLRWLSMPDPRLGEWRPAKCRHRDTLGPSRWLRSAAPDEVRLWSQQQWRPPEFPSVRYLNEAINL